MREKSTCLSEKPKRWKEICKRIFAMVVLLFCIWGLASPSFMHHCLLINGGNSNFGKVRMGNTIIKKFYLTNISLSTVHIRKVQPLCSCSVASVSDFTIKPFHKVLINLTVYTKELSTGSQEKGALVFLENGDTIEPLRFSFTVVK